MILSDLHTHTVFSHGKGTVYDNVLAAQNAGLKQVGISDHSFSHMLYGVSQKGFALQKKQVDAAKKECGIEILLGLEANICSRLGALDLAGRESEVDYVIAGFHKAVAPTSFSDKKYFGLYSGICNAFRPGKTKIAEYTRICVKAITTNKVDILCHPNYGVALDIAQVGKAAADYGVLIELNGKRINMTDEEILCLLDTGVNFILGSDAHSPQKVGRFELPLSYVQRLNIPVQRIANYDKTVTFARRR